MGDTVASLKAASPEAPAADSSFASQPAETESAGVRSVADIAADHYQALRQYSSVVVSTGDVEAVHKLRVVTRKLQAALDILPKHPPDVHVRRLKRLLRRWRRSLSEVRNYDVFLTLMENEWPVSNRMTDDSLAVLKTEFQEHRGAALSTAVGRLDQATLDRFSPSLGLAVAAPPEAFIPNIEIGAGPDGSSQTSLAWNDTKAVTARASERLTRRFDRFERSLTKSAAKPTAANVHRLRITVKRLRYLLEIIGGIGHGDAQPALIWLKSFQDKLGAWHDMAALEGEIVAALSHKKFLRDHTDESVKLLQLTSRLRKKREATVNRLIPSAVPRILTRAKRRLIRALDRQSGKKARRPLQPAARNVKVTKTVKMIE